jgi:hypothetical protein
MGGGAWWKPEVLRDGEKTIFPTIATPGGPQSTTVLNGHEAPVYESKHLSPKCLSSAPTDERDTHAPSV